MGVVVRPTGVKGPFISDSFLHDPSAIQAAKEAIAMLFGHGTLSAFIGPMFAGKTAALMTAATYCLTHQKKVLTFKPFQDTRYQGDQEQLVTHNGYRLNAEGRMSLTTWPDTFPDLFEKSHVILIDEAHMFDEEDLIAFVTRSIQNAGKHVFIAGIDQNTNGRPLLSGISRLLVYCNFVHRYQAQCDLCPLPAPFTVRITPVRENNWVGGTEDYVPLCRAHWMIAMTYFRDDHVDWSRWHGGLNPVSRRDQSILECMETIGLDDDE